MQKSVSVNLNVFSNKVKFHPPLPPLKENTLVAICKLVVEYNEGFQKMDSTKAKGGIHRLFPPAMGISLPWNHGAARMYVCTCVCVCVYSLLGSLSRCTRDRQRVTPCCRVYVGIGLERNETRAT